MAKTRNRGNGSGSIFKRREDGPYCISWYDAQDKRREHNTRTTDKQTAERILADKLADVALRREGIIDARQEALAIQSNRPIEEHLTDFEAMLTARQRSENHISRTIAFVREVCSEAGFEKPNDISADGVNRVMAAMKSAGRAPRTIQARVVATKSFTKWLTDHNKLAHDPLRSVKRPSTKADRRLRRRMLTPGEWPYLRAATLASGQQYGMNPLDRMALYALAIQTGLRSSELRSLTKADLFLSGEKPYVRCRAENTKNHHEARQYIQADLAGELRRIVATKTPNASLFNLPNGWEMATMLRGDLEAARQHWLDEVKHEPEARAKRAECDFLADTNYDGESLDFHSLRHTCGSWLALQGVHPNVIKTVMRHSSITLTMDTYGHLLPEQHAEAVGGMLRMLSDGQPLAATGTVGKAPAVQTAVGLRKQSPPGATQCDDVRQTANDDQNSSERKSLRIADVCEVVRADAAETDNGPDWIRTSNQGIMSPLLCR